MTNKQQAVLEKMLLDRTFQNMIGGEEWSLTEEEEVILWDIIRKVEKGSMFT